MKKKETVVEKNEGLSSFFADLVSRDEEICVTTTSKKKAKKKERKTITNLNRMGHHLNLINESRCVEHKGFSSSPQAKWCERVDKAT